MKITKLIYSLFVNLVFVSVSWAGAYDYNQLQLKDFDEMKKLLREVLNQNVTQPPPEDYQGPELADLRQALRLVFARPDSDNMREKLIPLIRPELQGFDAYESSIQDIAKESIRGLGDSSRAVMDRATDIVILDNVLQEMKPEILSKKVYEETTQLIRDAKLKIPDDVAKKMKTLSMRHPSSPSETAGKLMDAVKKAREKSKKDKK